MFYIPENQDFVLRSKVFIFHKKVMTQFKNFFHLEMNFTDYYFLLCVSIYVSMVFQN